jgi:hypothetical protein
MTNFWEIYIVSFLVSAFVTPKIWVYEKNTYCPVTWRVFLSCVGIGLIPYINIAMTVIALAGFSWDLFFDWIDEGWLDKSIFEKKKKHDYDDEKFTGVF